MRYVDASASERSPKSQQPTFVLDDGLISLQALLPQLRWENSLQIKDRRFLRRQHSLPFEEGGRAACSRIGSLLGSDRIMQMSYQLLLRDHHWLGNSIICESQRRK